MAHHKNQKITCSDYTQFKQLSEEIGDYIGRDIVTNESRLEITVLSMPRRYKKKADRENRLKRQRQKRDEDYSIPTEEDER